MIGNWLCSVNDFPISQMECNTHTPKQWRNNDLQNNSVSQNYIYQCELFTSLQQQHSRPTWRSSGLISRRCCPARSLRGLLRLGFSGSLLLMGGLAEPPSASCHSDRLLSSSEVRERLCPYQTRHWHWERLACLNQSDGSRQLGVQSLCLVRTWPTAPQSIAASQEDVFSYFSPNSKKYPNRQIY